MVKAQSPAPAPAREKRDKKNFGASALAKQVLTREENREKRKATDIVPPNARAKDTDKHTHAHNTHGVRE